MALFKILISAVLIWAVSEIGKKSGKLGGLLLSLPLTSLIAIAWLWIDTKDTSKVSNLTSETLLFILPSLILFLVLPFLLNRSVPFYLAFFISIFSTLISYSIFFKLRGIS